MKIRFAASLLTLAWSITVFGCSDHSRVRDVDLSTAHVANAAGDESGWRKAAIMPFDETGKAQFIWDDKTLRGRVDKHDPDKWSHDPDERVCVAISVDNQIVRLYFKAGSGGNASPEMIFEKATVTDGSENDPASRLLDQHAVNAVSHANFAQHGTAFSLEFALSWEAVTPLPPAQCRVAIEAYRIAPQRSQPRYFVGMKPAELTR